MTRLMKDTLEIQNLAFGGFGVGTFQGKKVFVPYTIPGEKVRFRMARSHRRYAWAELVEVLEPSPRRRQPPCAYFSSCGGCHWQHLPYQDQLYWKERIFKETLQRIGGIAPEQVRPILLSPLTLGYRRKLSLKADRGRLGLFAPRSHRLVEVQSCLLASTAINKALGRLQGKLASFPLSQVELVSSPSGQGLSLYARFTSPLSENMKARLVELAGSLGGMGSLYGEIPGGGWGLSLLSTSSWAPGPVFAMPLKDLASFGTLKLTYWPGVFIQVNWEQNTRLVEQMLEVVGEVGKNLSIMELHAGAGNFTLPLAAAGHRVESVEQNPLAVANAKFNLAFNGLKGVELVPQKNREALKEAVIKGKTFDLLLVDPPRSGLKREMGALLKLKVPYMIYVSCHPATLARDLKILEHKSYRLQWTQPMDFFPQTYHVESLSFLKKG